jgi:hypothetical protein
MFIFLVFFSPDQIGANLGGDNNFEDFNQGQFGPQGCPVLQLPNQQQQQQPQQQQQ